MHTLPKQEKIKSRKEIEMLFKNGKRIHNGYLHLMYLKYDQHPPNFVKISFSVPKKKMALATDRNRMKRLLREVYRLDKPNFLEKFENQNFLMMLIYNSKEEVNFKNLKENYAGLMVRFQKHLSQIPKG